MHRKFERTIENFTCENCKTDVLGNGYTNHCPECLWSKHVDINPGDRREVCEGLMKPKSIDLKAGEYVLVHQCQACGFERRNKIVKEDNFNTILEISGKI